MAGDWIKMRHSLLRDGRVVRMMSALKADRLRTIGGLFSAWCLFDEQTDDGRLSGYTAETFDEMVGLPGIADAMESVGWLVVGDDFVEMTGFEQHNGRSAKRRAQDSVRKRSGRLSASEADVLRTREEKRREEKRRDKSKKAGSATAAARPTVEEVAAYCQERGNEIDPEHFIDHYTANGWKQSNGNTIRDWRAAVRTWEKRKFQTIGSGAKEIF